MPETKTRADDTASRTTRKPKQKRSQARVDKILACAEQIISEKGLSALPVQDVAALSGTPTGTIYEYFENSTAIIEALAQKYFQDLRRIANKANECRIDTEEDLKVFFDRAWDEYYAFNLSNPAAAEMLLSITANKKLALMDETDTLEAIDVIVQATKHLFPDSQEDVLHHTYHLIVMLARETVRIALKAEGNTRQRLVERGRRGMHTILLSRDTG